MTSEPNGRLVDVRTKFHREAVKPGGVARNGAKMASDRSIFDLRSQVEQQLSAAVGPLANLLRAWPAGDVARGCDWAGQVRDLAGLADMHLLTEVAMHTFDCLDAVHLDGATMEPAEAFCYADALVFAQQTLCRGQDVEPYRPLLTDLERLTTLVIERRAGVPKSA